MSFPNNYTHRKVAEANARACEICFKPSTSVLITPEKKDFFYICPSHLKDTGFCTPIIDQEAVEAKKKKELDDEVARLKEEYEEKQRKKKEKAEKDKEKDKKKKDEEGKDKDKDSKTDGDKSKDENEESGDKTETESPPAGDEPRVFELKRTFYSHRLDKKRQGEIAKRNRERLQNPTFFPSVPKGLP